MNRRESLRCLSGLFGSLAALASPRTGIAAEGAGARLAKSKSDWAALLPPDAYRVLFEEDTERPGSSPLNAEKRAGTFVCAACNQPLFDAAHKYESGTGWPSFWKPLDNAVATRTDKSFGMARTEAHCRRCGGHLGHIFDDGPPPTGLRYCMNGLSLAFTPKSA